MTHRGAKRFILVGLVAAIGAMVRPLPAAAAPSLRETTEAFVRLLLAACGSGHARRVEPLFTDEAPINGLSRDAAMQSYDGKTQTYRLIRPPMVLDRGATSRTLAFAYTVRDPAVRGTALVDLVLNARGAWRIVRLARLCPDAPDHDRAPLLAVNPVRNLFVGATHRQAVRCFLPDGSAPVTGAAWTASLETDASTYDVSVSGPEAFSRGETITLEIHVPAGLARQPDLTAQRPATLVLRCKAGSEAGERTMRLPVRTYDNTTHHALHAALVKARRTGKNHRLVFLEEIRVRFRVLDLSHTYYACMRVKSAYAGFQYQPGQTPVYAYWFSVWNNAKAGWAKRNRFLSVGPKEEGWTTVMVPERDYGDKNYASIQNTRIGWRPGTEYTFVLKVRPCTTDGERWTALNLTALEHGRTQQGEPAAVTRTVPFGSILRYGDHRLSYCNAFMEALGRKWNFERRQMEFVHVSYRPEGGGALQEVDLRTVTTSATDPARERDRYPRSAWLARGRLRLSTGGQTPLRPGLLLLDY